jgi:hypothetical protein
VRKAIAEFECKLKAENNFFFRGALAKRVYSVTFRGYDAVKRLVWWCFWEGKGSGEPPK